MMRKYVKCLVVLFAMLFLVTGSASATVNVYAEGAYTDSDLVVYVYVDVTVEPILSYGVKLTYDDSDLESPVVEKNDGDWYFGDKAAPFPTPNAEPDTTTSGEIVIVGGKLDSASPQEGVSGERVLLAKVTFSRKTNNPPSVALHLGKGGSYSNFVTTNGDVLDGTQVTFLQSVIEPECNLDGDINDDGVVNYIDLSQLQTEWLKSGTDIGNGKADINGDGIVNYIDLSMLQTNWLKECR